MICHYRKVYNFKMNLKFMNQSLDEILFEKAYNNWYKLHGKNYYSKNN